jgi:putative membrane protein
MPPQQGFDHGFDAGHHLFGSGWPILGIAMFLILISVVVWAVLRITRAEARPAFAGGPPTPRADGALDEVRLRYARGEMTRDEFVQRFADLGGPTPPPATTSSEGTPTITPVPPDDPSPGGAEPPPAA